MKNMTPHATGQAQPVRVGRTSLGKNQAHLQIRAFMDCYQKDMIGKLAPNPVLNAERHDTTVVETHIALETSSTDPKTDRAKLHKIWLAMKPSYKPATVF